MHMLVLLVHAHVHVHIHICVHAYMYMYAQVVLVLRVANSHPNHMTVVHQEKSREQQVTLDPLFGSVHVHVSVRHWMQIN